MQIILTVCPRSTNACTGGGKPTYSELVELQSQGRASPIRSALLEELDSVLAVAQHWLHRCTAAMARRSAQTLKSCLEAMGASVQRAQEQMEAQLRKLQVRLGPAGISISVCMHCLDCGLCAPGLVISACV